MSTGWQALRNHMKHALVSLVNPIEQLRIVIEHHHHPTWKSFCSTLASRNAMSLVTVTVCN
jgi:hypothetical protein